MRNSLFLIVMSILLICCHDQNPAGKAGQMPQVISRESRDRVAGLLKEKHGEAALFRIEKGVSQVAGLWRETDGNAEDFENFCTANFVSDPEALNRLFTKLERNFEILNGYFNKIGLQLKEPLDLEGPGPEPVDLLFGSYNPSAHLTDDFFANKIAFITALNFPFYPLKEKTESGSGWSRKEWAYARMGDRFTQRIPAEIIQKASVTLTEADTYISNYNIYMGKLTGSGGNPLFPGNMKLITHWGLRDELKSDYATENGLEKQRMIYQVMRRIIDQSIPQQVINSDAFLWDPFSNKISRDGKEIEVNCEPDRRYEVLLANFHAMKAVDPYTPNHPTFISRAFEAGMEIPQEDVEQLFTELVSSPMVKEVATLISSRLGRPLEPFDIWYNGFRASGGIPEEKLTAITSRKYPDTKAVRADLPAILVKLGWPAGEAQRIASLVTVDAARGSGHAWGSSMRNDLAHLRTRIAAGGMDYKGYNIAIHEFGHNVEQTITMNDVDYYMLNGVPNTAFTEAVAFLFQKRDIELLGIKNENPQKEHFTALDNFWACYEIMGVSLVDMEVWKWLYAHPEATPGELKNAVISIAKEVWNKYYAGILGGSDEPLLAIYSHMIDNPLYLSNYPVGHLIDFQIEQFVAGKELAAEITRMLKQGCIVPQLWMEGAVGEKISITPTIEAAGKALQALTGS